MATFDTNLQMWKAANGTYWPDKASAETADSGPNADAAGPSTAQTGDFLGGSGSTINYAPQAPHDPNDDPNPANPNGLSNNAMQYANQNRITNLQNIPYGTPISQGGTAQGYQVSTQNSGYAGNAQSGPDVFVQAGDYTGAQSATGQPTWQNTGYQGGYSYDANGKIIAGGNSFQGGVVQPSIGAPANAAGFSSGGGSGGGTGVPGQTQGQINATDANSAAAGNAYNTEAAQNAAQDPILAKRAADAAAGVQGPNDAQAQQSRRLQAEGAQQQRDLLARLEAFDPKQYASQFSDQALARSVALARGSSSSPGAQQAATMAALDQAPALYAQGQQQADSLENQRLGQAEQAAQGFANLATGTRSQDLNESQFSADFGLKFAQNIEATSQGQIKLNDTQQQQIGDIYVNWGRIASVYDSWPVDMQKTWLENQVRLTLGDQTLQGIEDQIKAKGAITSKDWLNVFTGLAGDAVKVGAPIVGGIYGGPGGAAAGAAAGNAVGNAIQGSGDPGDGSND